jgi:oligopeptide transport system ATP-binding protein
LAALVLDVKELVTRFYIPEGVVHAVNGVSFTLEEGETLGIVGESGCGKSVTMLSILRLIPQPPGKIEHGEALFLGRDLLKIPLSEMRKVRGAEIGMVFQDPMTSLNPVLTIGKQISEPMVEHLGMTQKQANERAVELLDLVGIPQPKDRLTDYPHQFSGGMRQRAMIAMALSCSPKILIADEPTTALDVTIQAQIVDLVNRLQEQLGMAVIWITHDLGVVARVVRRVIVLYAGFIVETAPVKEVYANPSHPYTMGLLGSIPRLDQRHGTSKLTSIEGRPPDLFDEPTSCPFTPRCPYVEDLCREQNPELRFISDTHRIACWFDVHTKEKTVVERMEESR